MVDFAHIYYNKVVENMAHKTVVVARNRAHTTFRNCFVDHVEVKNNFHIKVSKSKKLNPYSQNKKKRKWRKNKRNKNYKLLQN